MQQARKNYESFEFVIRDKNAILKHFKEHSSLFVDIIIYKMIQVPSYDLNRFKFIFDDTVLFIAFFCHRMDFFRSCFYLFVYCKLRINGTLYKKPISKASVEFIENNALH